MASVLALYAKALRRFGWKDTLTQLYTMGQVKFGEKVGDDDFGNQYFENRVDYPLGQNRWVMYKDHDNPDASMVPPEWHSWLHAMTDTPGNMIEQQHYRVEDIGEGSDDPYGYDFLGYTAHRGHEVPHEPDLTSFHPRGYAVGSIYTDWPEDRTYKPPGDHKPDVDVWSPDQPENQQAKDPRLRPLSEN